MLKLNVNHFVIFTFYCNYLRIQLHRPKKKKEYSLRRMKNKSSENPRFIRNNFQHVQVSEIQN